MGNSALDTRAISYILVRDILECRGVHSDLDDEFIDQVLFSAMPAITEAVATAGLLKWMNGQQIACSNPPCEGEASYIVAFDQIPLCAACASAYQMARRDLDLDDSNAPVLLSDWAKDARNLMSVVGDAFESLAEAVNGHD